MKNTSVFFDTNVIIDLVTKRGPSADASLRLFEMCKDKILDGFMSVQSISDIFYILRKDYSVRQRKEILLDVCDVLEVVGVEKWHALSALSDDGFSDLEDCILAKCAEDHGFDFVASRNAEDFAASKISVMTPQDLLEHLNAANP